MFYKRVTSENKDHFLCFSQIAGERYLQDNHMVLQRMTLLLRFHNHQEAFNGYVLLRKKMLQLWQRLNKLKVEPVVSLQKLKKNTKN